MRRALSRCCLSARSSSDWTRRRRVSCCPSAAAPGLGGGVAAVLQYQRPPAPGERVGRVSGDAEIPHLQQLFFDTPPGESTKNNDGVLTDVHAPAAVHIADARQLVPQATLETRGFELRRW